MVELTVMLIKMFLPIKYPSTDVINEALFLYQTSFRKPIHVVFALDYSGSMYGYGYEQMIDAMDYILTDRANEELIQFSNEDIIDVIPFASEVYTPWHTDDGSKTTNLLASIKGRTPRGSTALFPATKKALELLVNENQDKYNTSIIILTDGEGNVGSYNDLKKYYTSLNKEIPIYSIQFLDASKDQLEALATLSNGKVFDADDGLVEAFKEVRGYN